MTLTKLSLPLVGSMLFLVFVMNMLVAIQHISSPCLNNPGLNSMHTQENEAGMRDIVLKLRSRINELEKENTKNKNVHDESKRKTNQVNRKVEKENTNNMDKVKKGINLAATPVASEKTNTTDFVRHDNVAIVTKIHGEHQWALLEQSLCLLHYAYNHKVLYDIVVFTTEAVPEKDIQELQATLSPVKVSVVVDNKGLQNEIADLSPAKHEALKELCNVTDTKNLTWFSTCQKTRLAYNWQAEFRGRETPVAPSQNGQV